MYVILSIRSNKEFTEWGVANISKSMRGVVWCKRLKTPSLDNIPTLYVALRVISPLLIPNFNHKNLVSNSSSKNKLRLICLDKTLFHIIQAFSILIYLQPSEYINPRSV